MRMRLDELQRCRKRVEPPSELLQIDFAIHADIRDRLDCAGFAEGGLYIVFPTGLACEQRVRILDRAESRRVRAEDESKSEVLASVEGWRDKGRQRLERDVCFEARRWTKRSTHAKQYVIVRSLDRVEAPRVDYLDP